jgi:hypothetical protein
MTADKFKVRNDHLAKENTRLKQEADAFGV